MKRADFLSVPRVVIALAIAVPSPISLRAQVQSSEPHPSFEVASIKQNTSPMTAVRSVCSRAAAWS
jgi:hypothetical protein